MKVLHLCLGAFYIDNYAYQENMLPKYHKKMGYEVSIIAGLMSFDVEGKVCYLPEAKEYINEYGIPVTRLDYADGPGKLTHILKPYKNLNVVLDHEKPDILFIHNLQFISIRTVIKYLKKHKKVKTYVDNHCDYSNSATNWISKNILHKIIWRYYAKKIEPYVIKFYGVLPARVDFLINMYKLPKEKVKLLVMGADDEMVDIATKSESITKIRNEYNIAEKDFLIMTGGKIDSAKKQILLLMEAVKNINDYSVKLIVFGSIENELLDELNSLVDGDKIKYAGWLSTNDAYLHFGAADLVVFPGRHSVFWEQVVALGIPMICKKWDGTTHIDIGGNVEFLEQDSSIVIERKIRTILADKEKYSLMKDIAINKGKTEFLYSDIARRSLS